MRGLALVVGLAAAALWGCGDTDEITGGGRIIGDDLVVHSLLPLRGPAAPVARDVLDGQRLALLEAGGRAGAYDVALAARDLGAKPAEAAREALRDPAAAAVVGDLGNRTARVTVPLLNTAGILHVSPGASYTGFVAPLPGAPDEPERWRPSGRRTFAPVVPADAEQAAAIADVVLAPVAVEAEAAPAPHALARGVRRHLGRRATGDVRIARTVVYAGEDVDTARGVVPSLALEAPRARIVLPEALLRGGLARLLPRRVARRVRFMSATPPAPPAFARAFERRLERCAGPYAHVGYRAMRAVLAAIRRAGVEAKQRQSIVDAFFATYRPPRGGWVTVPASAAGCAPARG